jgi:hypothetical protein
MPFRAPASEAMADFRPEKADAPQSLLTFRFESTFSGSLRCVEGGSSL